MTGKKFQGFTAIPKRWIDKAKDIMNDMFSALVGYLKSTYYYDDYILFDHLFIGFIIQ